MTRAKGEVPEAAHDSPKRQGDKLESARAKAGGTAAAPAPEAAGAPGHDSPKRQGDKLERARDAASGKGGTG